MPTFSRTVAMTAWLGATMLASPLTAMAADTVPPALNQAEPASAVQQSPRETVEQQIASLHASLGITAGEEADWNGVTKAMRENAAVMEKLVAERSVKDRASMTAVDDLTTYEAFCPRPCRGPEGADRLIHDAVQVDAGCAEEGCRRCVPEVWPREAGGP